MFKRKNVNITTPSEAGVYRPKSSSNDAMEMNEGRHNPAFVLDPETLAVPSSDQGSGLPVPESGDNSHRSNDSNSSSSGISSIEEMATDTQTSPGSGGSGSEGGRNASEVEVMVEASTSKQPQLKKSINLLHCTAIMVAVTGHSSIFISPAAILAVSGSIGASLIIWFIGGVINMGLALVFAEVGTMMPTAGGPYAYVLLTFGPLPGFLILWGYVVLIAGPFWAFLAYTAGLYIVRPIFHDCQPSELETGIKLLAGWIMITLVVLNCVYMKYVTKIQTFLSSTKIIALLIIIVGGIYELAKGNTKNFESIFEGTTEEPGQFALAIFYSIFSYGGWQVVTSLMEELKNPGRDLPLSVYLTFTIVIIKYILANMAFFTLITPGDMVDSSAVALLFVERLYNPLSAVIAVMVATTSIGALNASIMGHSRLLFAGARSGHMPVIMGMLHYKFLTPWPAILVLMVWGLVMLYAGSITDMMEFISLFSTIMGITVVCSLFYLRYTKPNEPRHYKTMLLVPLSQLLINCAVLVLAVYQKPHKMGIGLAILFAGIPVYWVGVLWKSKPPEFTQIVEGLTIFAQKSFLLTKTQ